MKLHLAYQFSVLTGLLTTASSASVPQMDFNPLKFSAGKTKMPYPVSDMTASVAPATSSSLDPLVFIVGGCDSPQGNVRAEWDDQMFYCSTVTDRTIAYDPAQDTFVSKKNMLRERYRHAAAVVNGMIWVIGGRDADDNTVHEVDMYNPLTDEWTYVANMTESLARSDLTAFASSSQTDHFYVTGGYDATYAAFGTTLKIDAAASLSTNEIQYEEQKEMPTPRGDIQSVVLDDNFAYVIGGYTPSNNWCKALTVVEKYNLESNTWTTEPSLTNARGDKAAVLLNDKIYAIGGESNNGECGTQDSATDADPSQSVLPIDDVEVYNTNDSGGWTVLQEIPSERFRFTGVAYPETGTIFLFGGQKFYSGMCDCFATSNEVLFLTNEAEVESAAVMAWSRSAIAMALLAIGFL